MTDHTDLIIRLREQAENMYVDFLNNAADTIEAQAAEIDFWKGRMREALKTIKENNDRIAELEEINKRQEVAINELRMVNSFEDVAWKAKDDRIAELEQVSAMVCERCGWAMKFPGEECRNCAYEKQSIRIAKLEDDSFKYRMALADIQMKAQDTLRPIPFQDEDE